MWMQKFCITFFPLNSLPYPQQMNDAEILHLKSVACKMWMQKFCMTLFSTYGMMQKFCISTKILITVSGLKNFDPKNSTQSYLPLNSAGGIFCAWFNVGSSIRWHFVLSFNFSRTLCFTSFFFSLDVHERD